MLNLATNTPNLDLYKVDPATDGDKTFNVTTMLNENWDKIDAAVQGVKDDVGNIDLSKITPESIGAETPAGAQEKANAAAAASVPINGAVNKHGFMNIMSDGQTLGLLGSTTSFVGFYPKGNVDRAGYIGASRPNEWNAMVLAADNGPLALYGNIVYLNDRNVLSELDQLKQSGVNAKQGIVDAINAMGGSASTADSWAVLAQKIRQITRGITDVYLLRHFAYYRPGGDVPAFFHPSIQPGFVTGDATYRPDPGQGYIYLSAGANGGGSGICQMLTNQAFDLTNVALIEYTIYRDTNFENHTGGYNIMLGATMKYNVAGVYYDRYKTYDFSAYAGGKPWTVYLDVRDLQGTYYIGISKQSLGITQLGFNIRGIRLIQNTPPV